MIYFIIYTNVIMQIYYFMSDFLYSKIYFWDSTFAFMSVLVDHSFLCHTLFMKRCSASLKTENSKLKLHRNTVFIYQIGKIFILFMLELKVIYLWKAYTITHIFIFDSILSHLEIYPADTPTTVLKKYIYIVQFKVALFITEKHWK